MTKKTSTYLKFIMMAMVALFINVTVSQATHLTPGQICGVATIANLTLNGSYSVGNVSIKNSQDTLYITYHTTGGWLMKKINLYVGNCSAMQQLPYYDPTLRKAYPFTYPYHSPDFLNATDYSFKLPTSSFDSCFCITAEAVVYTTGSGNVKAFAGSQPYPNTNFPVYIPYCKIQCCFPPTNVTVSNITSSTALISWTTRPNGYYYEIRKRVFGGNYTDWVYSNVFHPADHRLLVYLSANTVYEYQVRTICNNGADTSAWTIRRAFLTLANCSEPTSLYTDSVTSTTATVHWTASAGAVSYKVRYRPVTQTSFWFAVQVPSTSYTLTGLTPSTQYVWQVRTNCAADISAFTVSNPQFFTTLAPRLSNENRDINILGVYPNPSTGNISVNAFIGNYTSKLQVVNMLGQIVFDIIPVSKNGYVNEQINLDNQLNGVYYVKLSVGQKEYISKLVLSK